MKTAIITLSIGGFFFALGCQSPRLSNERVSHLDLIYQENLNPQIKAESGSSVDLYQNVVAKTLYSHCKWYPSDSNFTASAQKRCGAVQGTVMGFARFLSEEDAAHMGYDVTQIDGKLRWVDIPDACVY